MCYCCCLRSVVNKYWQCLQADLWQAVHVHVCLPLVLQINVVDVYSGMLPGQTTCIHLTTFSFTYIWSVMSFDASFTRYLVPWLFFNFVQSLFNLIRYYILIVWRVILSCWILCTLDLNWGQFFQPELQRHVKLLSLIFSGEESGLNVNSELEHRSTSILMWHKPWAVRLWWVL